MTIAECAFIKDFHNLHTEERKVNGKPRDATYKLKNSLIIPKGLQDIHLDVKLARQSELVNVYYRTKFSILLAVREDPDQLDNRISNAKSELEECFNTNLAKTFIEFWKNQREHEELAALLRFMQFGYEKAIKHWYDAAESVNPCGKWCKSVHNELNDRASVPTAGLPKALENKFAVLKTDMEERTRTETPGSDDPAPLPEGAKETFLSDYAASSLQQKYLDKTSSSSRNVTAFLSKAFELMTNDDQEDDAQAKELIKVATKCAECEVKECALAKEMRDPLPKFLSELGVTLSSEGLKAGLKKIEVIDVFLKKVKERYHCDVCDYLEQQDVSLVWGWSTVDPGTLLKSFAAKTMEKVRQEIIVDESYTELDGITGSVLYLDPPDDDCPLRYVGSNDVGADPRASWHHVTTYKRIQYGEEGILTNNQIANFWCFPLFVDKQLHGVFRVVNRHCDEVSTRVLQPGGWAYVDRVELAEIAIWFSSYLSGMLPFMDMAESYTDVVAEWAQADDFKNVLGASNVDTSQFQHLLNYLFRLSRMRSESRSIGVSILVFSHANSKLSDCDLFFLGSKPRIEMMRRHLEAMDPLEFAVECDSSLVPIKIVRLECPQGSGTSGVQAIKNLTGDTQVACFCLLLPIGSSRIEGYAEGQLKAVLYVSEENGRWYLLDAAKIKDAIRNHLPVQGQDTREAQLASEQFVNVIVETALRLAVLGKGGILIVGKMVNAEKKLTRAKIHLKQGNSTIVLGSQALAELAKLDGAVLITNDGTLVDANRNWSRGYITPQEDTKARKFFDNHGNRHKAAMTIASDLSSGFVVVVSENRGMTVIPCNIDELVEFR